MIFSARFRYHHWASYIIAGGPDNDGSASLNIEVKVSVSNSGWCTLLCNISLLIGWWNTGPSRKNAKTKAILHRQQFLQKQLGSQVKNKCIPQYWGEGISEPQQMVQSRYDWFAPPFCKYKEKGEDKHKNIYRDVPIALVCTILCKDKDTCNHKHKVKAKTKANKMTNAKMAQSRYNWFAILCNSLLMIMTSKIDK